MDDLSDFEDCEIYTKTAENIRKKKKQFLLKLEDLEKSPVIVPDDGDSDDEYESLMDTLLKDTDKSSTKKKLKDKLDKNLPVLKREEQLGLEQLVSCNYNSKECTKPKRKHFTKKKNSHKLISEGEDYMSVENVSDSIISPESAVISTIQYPNVDLLSNKDRQRDVSPPLVLRRSSRNKRKSLYDEAGLNKKQKFTRENKKTSKNKKCNNQTRRLLNNDVLVNDSVVSSLEKSSDPNACDNSLIVIEEKCESAKEKSVHRRHRDIEDCSNTGNGNIIVLDDDSDFLNASLSPIVFKTKKLSVNLAAKQIEDSSSYTNLLSDNDSVKISIEWHGNKYSIMRFELQRTEEFETIFDKISEMENVPKSRIELKRMSQWIIPTDTPKSLNLVFHGALTGSLCHSDIDFDQVAKLCGKELSNDSITVQIKSEDQETINLKIKKHDKVAVIYKKCASRLKCAEHLIRLTFDGDYADPTQIVSSLDIEDGDMFNIHIGH